MTLSSEVLRAIAQAFLGRDGIEPEIVEETTRRLEGLLARLRQVDEERLQQVLPAFSFDPTHAAYQTEPLPGAPVWAGLAGTPGGTGYGGTTGTTGVSESANSAAVLPTAAPPAAGGPAGAPATPAAGLEWSSAAELAAAVRSRQISPVELTRAVLDRLAASQPALNAFVTIMADQAMAQAREREAALLRGEELGPLHGVPVAVKDLYETAGVRTTAGSQILAGYVPDRDATTVRRLLAAGAVLVGKTATHEFAFGPTTDSPYLGPTRNPWNLEHVPAGSSGGSGAAVAAGLVPLALGTDTGGSIRMPAAACGVVGLKPSYGRVSKYGVLPLSWSLDHAGPMAATVVDAAMALAVLAGPDELDPTALPVPAEDYVAAARAGEQAAAGGQGLAGVRLGVPPEWLETPLDPEVRKAFAAAVETFRSLGAEVTEATLPPADVMTFVNRLITLGEAGAYHAPFLAREADRYAPDVRGRLELAQYILARDYLTGQRLRAELSRQMAQVMQRFDAILVLTLPIPAPRIGQGIWEYPDGSRETVQEALIRFTAPFSVSGQPALSVPCGFTSGGLPIGLQIVGKPFAEATVLHLGAAYTSAIADTLRRRPPFRF